MPLDAYIQHDESVAASARLRRSRRGSASGFAHLIVDDEVLEQLGPAVNANKAVFLYGPPGNGKTVLGEGMGRALGGDVYVPHAIDVDGQTITVFDPVLHDHVDDDEDEAGSVRRVAGRAIAGGFASSARS